MRKRRSFLWSFACAWITLGVSLIGLMLVAFSMMMLAGYSANPGLTPEAFWPARLLLFLAHYPLPTQIDSRAASSDAFSINVVVNLGFWSCLLAAAWAFLTTWPSPLRRNKMSTAADGAAG